MADSKYPNELDTDVELPIVDDNIVEIGGDAINGLRSAVFNIEQTLGVNPQGTATDVAARLNQSLNPDGTIKASALSTIGLVTLPITNSMVANNAGILESKLDLNYSTKNLRELIGALRVEHDALVLTVQGDITNLSRHVAHPSAFGRHRTSDIDGYIGKYLNYNLQGIVDDLDTRITDHLSDPVDAHDASAVSFNDADTFITADEVQTAIEELDNLGFTTLRIHQDNQHSNGILTSQKIYEPNTYHGKIVVSSSLLNTIASGSMSVTYVTPPSDLSQVVRGDRIDITIGTETYTRDIESIDASSGTVYLFLAIPNGGLTPSAVIYRTPEETSAPNTLNLSIRHDTIAGNLGGSVIQLIHPGAPYILSNGLDVRKITSTEKNIQFAWDGGETGEIDAYQALQTYPIVNTTPSIWTPENLVIALNEEFKKDANNYPIIAFSYRGEIGFAFDEPDGYLALRIPSSDAWDAFGLNGSEIDYTLSPRRFYIDGYEFSSIRKIVDTTGTTDGSSAIKNINADLTALGVGQTGIVRVKNHTDSGTYVFNASTSNSLTISSHIGGFSTDLNVGVEIYADSFSVPINTGIRTLFELFIDGYDSYGELYGAKRVGYIAGGGSTSNPQEWFDIVEVSRNFSGSKRINFQDVGGNKIVKLGTPVTTPSTSTDVTSPGETYTLPTSNPVGHRFRLYDYNNVDYVDIEIADSSYTGVSLDQAVDLTIYERISEEKYIQIGQVLHDTSRFKHLSDRRLTGTVGRKDIRSDYSRDYISYPRSLLRGNGIIYGCETSGSLLVDGGQVLVNGNVYNINTVSLNIPTDGTASTYNIFIDENGVLRFLKDNQNNGAGFSTPSLAEILASSDKVILSQVDISSSNTVSEIRDLRRFVNNVDNKLDLFVENNEISHGSFASLQSAINYINAQTDPISRTIKIKGEYTYDLSNGAITLPSNTSLIGDGPNSGITLTSTNATAFIIPSSGCSVRNLKITSTGYTPSIFGDGSAISDFKIENCEFSLTASSSLSFISSGAITDLLISNCKTTFSGIGANYFIKSNDNFTNINIKNVNTTFSSTSENYFIYTTGNISNSIINCNVSFPDSSAGNYGVYGYTITDISISNSRFVCNSTDSNNLGVMYCNIGSFVKVINTYCYGWNTLITFATSLEDFKFNDNSILADSTITALFTITSLTSSVINNNDIQLTATSLPVFNLSAVNSTIIDNNVLVGTSVNTLLYALSAVNGLTVSKNYFDVGSITSGFDFNSTTQSILIDQNVLKIDANTSAVMDFTGSPGNTNDILITNNIIDLGSSSSSAYCIHGHGVNRFSITGNNIVNSYSGAGTGSAVRIYGTSSAGGNINISNNFISNAISTGGFEKGIELDGDGNFITNIIISGNVINDIGKNSSGTVSIYAKYVTEISIVNNHVTGARIPVEIDTSLNINIISNFLETSLGYQILYIHGSNNSYFVISNNEFVSASANNNEDLVYIDNSIRGIINGNFFRQSYLSVTSSKDMLFLTNTSTDWSITNNFFRSTGDYTTSVIRFDGTGCVVAHNNLKNVYSATSDNLIYVASGSYDHMNWGQQYYCIIPVSRFIPENGSNWVYDLSLTKHKAEISGNTSGDYGVIEFSDADIPVDSELKSVEIYTTTSGSTTDLSAQLFHTRWNDVSTSGSNISASASPTASPGIITLTPTSTEYIDNSYVYSVKFKINASNTVIIYGLRLTYIL